MKPPSILIVILVTDRLIFYLRHAGVDVLGTRKFDCERVLDSSSLREHTKTEYLKFCSHIDSR